VLAQLNKTPVFLSNAVNTPFGAFEDIVTIAAAELEVAVGVGACGGVGAGVGVVTHALFSGFGCCPAGQV